MEKVIDFKKAQKQKKWRKTFFGHLSRVESFIFSLSLLVVFGFLGFGYGTLFNELFHRNIKHGWTWFIILFLVVGGIHLVYKLIEVIRDILLFDYVRIRNLTTYMAGSGAITTLLFFFTFTKMSEMGIASAAFLLLLLGSCTLFSFSVRININKKLKMKFEGS